MKKETPNNHIIFHIDVNSAFLSWTAIKLLREGNPVDIRTIPAIVGGDQETRHGIVVAKSIPAKAYGIKTADTVASALKRCPNLVMVPPEHHYYKEQSQLLMDHLSSICPVIEQVSIDECYMDYEPIRSQYETPLEAAHFIKDSVREKFGFTVNVGISDRKVLAKMASDFQKPDRVHTLYSYEIQEKLWPLDISELHMCGKQSAARFRQFGVNTIGDLAQTDLTLVNSWMKSHGSLLWNYANGIDESEVVTEHGPAKGVGNSTTLAKNAETSQEAYAVLQKLAESVSSRLKKKHFMASQISVEIKYATFVSASHQTTVTHPINSVDELYHTSIALFDEMWNEEPIRLLGIRTTKLSEESMPVQLNFEDYLKEMERQEEEKRIAEQKRLEEERIAEQKRLEEERIAEQKRLEEERIAELKRLEAERIRQETEKKAEKNRSLAAALEKIKGKYGNDAIKKGL